MAHPIYLPYDYFVGTEASLGLGSPVAENLDSIAVEVANTVKGDKESGLAAAAWTGQEERKSCRCPQNQADPEVNPGVALARTVVVVAVGGDHGSAVAVAVVVAAAVVAVEDAAAMDSEVEEDIHRHHRYRHH